MLLQKPEEPFDPKPNVDRGGFDFGEQEAGPLDTSKKVCRLSKIWQEIEALPEQEELPGQMPRFLDEGEISNLKDWEAQQRLSRAERRVEERKIDLIRGEIAVETML